MVIEHFMTSYVLKESIMTSYIKILTKINLEIIAVAVIHSIRNDDDVKQNLRKNYDVMYGIKTIDNVIHHFRINYDVIRKLGTIMTRYILLLHT